MRYACDAFTLGGLFTALCLWLIWPESTTAVIAGWVVFLGGGSLDLVRQVLSLPDADGFPRYDRPAGRYTPPREPAPPSRPKPKRLDSKFFTAREGRQDWRTGSAGSPGHWFPSDGGFRG